MICSSALDSCDLIRFAGLCGRCGELGCFNPFKTGRRYSVAAWKWAAHESRRRVVDLHVSQEQRLAYQDYERRMSRPWGRE